jgi:hypothetical protein
MMRTHGTRVEKLRQTTASTAVGGGIKMDKEEVARRGHELYQSRLKLLVERDENIGKFLSLDVTTGAYEIGDDLLASALALRAKHPDAVAWTEKIGYRTAIAIGGTTRRTALEPVS